MQCVNCKEELTEERVQLFLRVAVCSDCRGAAEETRSKMRSALESLMARVDLNLQTLLAAGKFEAPAGDSASSLTYALEMDEVAAECRSTAQSMQITKQSALLADGKRSSDKQSAQG